MTKLKKFQEITKNKMFQKITKLNFKFKQVFKIKTYKNYHKIYLLQKILYQTV